VSIVVKHLMLINAPVRMLSINVLEPCSHVGDQTCYHSLTMYTSKTYCLSLLAHQQEMNYNIISRLML